MVRYDDQLTTLTPSTYGNTWSQKNDQSSTRRMGSNSSDKEAIFAFTVTMPAAINSRASAARVVSALDGEAASTVCICRFTRALRSSLGSCQCDRQRSRVERLTSVLATVPR